MIWHSSSIEDVKTNFNLDIKNGLSSQEAARKLKKYDYNTIYSTENLSFFKIIAKQLFRYPIIFGFVITLILCIANFIVDSPDWTSPILFIIITLFSVIATSLVEFKNDKDLKKIERSVSNKSVVIRNGEMHSVISEQLVPGDVILFKQGDYIPADCRLVETNNFWVDESLITNEVVAVEKNAESICDDIQTIEFRRNMAYCGCYVTAGEAKAIVVETGSFTEYGKNQATLIRDENVVVPLEKELKKPITSVSTALFSLSILFIVLGLFLQIGGFLLVDLNTWHNIVLIGALMPLSIIPSLPFIVSVIISSGIKRLYNNNVLLKKTENLEKICTTNIIIADKTGTLTHRRMDPIKAYAEGEVHKVSNNSPSSVCALMKMAALTCDGDVIFDKRGELRTGDSTETGILSSAFTMLKTNKKALENEFPRMCEIPLDTTRKIKTVVCLVDGAPYAIIKGTAQNVLKKCVGANNEKIMEAVNKFSEEACRVIAIAYKELSEVPANPIADELECDLSFVGLIASYDAPRNQAISQIKDCERNGIKTIMITGDTVQTAISSAKKLGIYKNDSKCLNGEEFDKLSDEEYNEIIDNVTVYSSISEEQRLRIIDTLQKKDYVVACTGDNVDDAKAMKKADVGIAMGRKGTALCKSASDMIINDDNFATVVKGIKECKATYLNFRKVLRQVFVTNISLICALFVGLFFFKTTILSVGFILVLGLILNVLTAFSVSNEPAHKDVLSKTIEKYDRVMTKGFRIDIAVQVIATIISVLLSCNYALDISNLLSNTNSYLFIQIAAFITLGFSSILLSYSNRGEKSFFTYGALKNLHFWICTAISFVIIILLTIIAPIASLFTNSVILPSFIQLIVFFAYSCIPFVINEIYKPLRMKFFK